MNATPLSASTTPAPALVRGQRSASGRRSWVFTISAICFVFGALAATQLRAIQQATLDQKRSVQGVKAQVELLHHMKAQAQAADAARSKLEAQLAALNTRLASTGMLSNSQIKALRAQMNELQAIAGLTRVTGPGLRITLSDNPLAAQGATGPFLPGIVHDFDVLQVVNELRACKADAIAVNGTRVTGYTPIRCVGPTIMVNWEPVAAPFKIDAVGDTQTLESALDMPNGIVDTLKNNGAIGVKISPMKNLVLDGATSIPTFHAARSAPPM